MGLQRNSEIRPGVNPFYVATVQLKGTEVISFSEAYILGFFRVQHYIPLFAILFRSSEKSLQTLEQWGKEGHIIRVEKDGEKH